MSASDAKPSGQTIILDSSSETDIIDCSIEETYNKNDFFKTPRSHLKRNCASAKKNEVISLKSFQFKNENHQVKIPAFDKVDNSLRCKLWSTFKANDSVISDDSVILTSTPESCKRNENRDDDKLHNLIPGLKNSPYLPYLGKSKLNRIENWLNENEADTASTPPFSSGRRSSLRLRKLYSTKSLATSQSRKNDASDSSAIDSEVERVLVAVYGKDWKAKNVLKKSRTEPKKGKKQIFSTKADFKDKAKTESKSVRTVRRNILKTGVRRGLIEDDSDNLSSPGELGVEKLNESGSTDDDGFIGKNLSSRKRLKTLSPCSAFCPKEPTVNKKITGSVKKIATRCRNKPIPEAVNSASAVPEPCTSRGKKTPTKTFLASLSVSTPKRRCDPEAQDFKLNFKTKKEELTMKLFKLYNSEVFGNGLPDDMNFTWNVKMRRTAGYCYNRKIVKTSGEVIRLCRIELSAKIVDRADRLRDTLIHELCHAASWVIDGMLDGHGTVWTKWSRKAMERFPELPQIKRCHNYQIASKYTYKCSGCGYSINRCSKSINTERKRCGFCFGVLELYVNRKKKGKGEVPEFDSTRTIQAPNSFALFVKDNYQTVRRANMGVKHAVIMKILSQKYSLTKQSVKTPVAEKNT